jgi:hypothetical protein
MSDTIGVPTSPLIAALMARSGGAPLLPPNSRYGGLPTQSFTTSDGREIVYLSRRFVPRADVFTSIGVHRMKEDERWDQVAARFLGDPLLSWRLADANCVMDPRELERRGRRVIVTLPQGVLGGDA